jgi:20S proteasome alpha/beta subunit
LVQVPHRSPPIFRAARERFKNTRVQIKGITRSPVIFMHDEDIVKQKGVQTGTTTVGLVCKDGIVLASDRRATMGYLIASKDIDKIYPIGDNIAMTIAGSVGDAQTLIR